MRADRASWVALFLPLLCTVVFGAVTLYGLGKWHTLSNQSVVGEGTVLRNVRYRNHRELVVELNPPAPRVQAKLINWRGSPAPGQVLHVRYAPGHPKTATEAGTSAFGQLQIAFAVCTVIVGGITIGIGRRLFRRPDPPAG